MRQPTTSTNERSICNLQQSLWLLAATGICILFPQLLSAQVTNMTTLTTYVTIQTAIDAATPGDVIQVGIGTYNESINVNKSLVLEGAQANTCAATRSGDESIINAVNGIGINADNVTLNGFTIQGQTGTNAGPGFGYAIFMAPPRTGTQLLNNIIKTNVIGSSLANTGASQALIECNWFDSNNNPGPASGNGIYTDEFVSGGVVSNVLINNNKFSGNTSAGITISVSQAALAATGITITNNEFSGNARAAFLYNTVSSSFSNNLVSGSTFTGSGELRIFGGVNNLTVMNNFFIAGTPHALRITDDGAGATNSNITVTENSFVGYSAVNVSIENASGYIGPLSATCNWYGSIVPATIAAQISGSVTYIPFLTSGIDGDPGTYGFQPSVACSIACPTVSFEIGGSSVTSTNNGAADPAESATVEVCDGGTYGVSNLVHSSATNRYSITVTPSGGVLLFDGNVAGNGDISAAQFDGAVGAHTITLSNPNAGGTLVQVITPYDDVNSNNTYDAGVDCAGDPVTITYTAHPTPLLQTSINSVQVTSNNDTADDFGAFSVCNSANNILFDYFTDLHGLTPAASVKAYQTFTVNNVTVPFCNNCAASLSAFAGATGTATLVDPSLPGTLEISFRAFLDENNNNVIDADECAGDLVTYTITVNPAPTFGFTATTTGGSTETANTNGGPTTVDLYFCPGESFSFSGYSSIPGSQVGYLEEIPSGTNNVTYNGGAVTVPRAQQDFGPSMVAGLLGGPFGPYNLSSGTSGSLTQTYTPYYDADNSNSYTAGDCLGDPITVNYYINAPAQLQTTVNTVQVTSNNDGVDDTSAFSVCNSAGNNLFFTQFVDLAGVTPAAQVKVQQQFTLTNVSFGPSNGTFPLSAYGTPFDRNVSLVNAALPGTLVMSFRTFNDINNNNILDAGECAGDWIVYTVTVNPVQTVTCPANLAVCENAAAFALTGGSPAGGTYSGTGVSAGMFDPATAGPGTHPIIYTANSCSAPCTFTITVNAAATVSFEIGGSSVTSTNNGAADPAESATVEVCDGGTYGVSNLVHSSATNRYSISVTPSGGVLLFDGNAAGNADISAAQFDGAVGAHTITLSNPNLGGTLVQVITPYNDVNSNGAYDAGVDCAGDPVTITYTAHPTPLLETSINSVIVTSNNDTAEDAGAFSVCNTANNILFDYFTDLHGLTPAASVKAYQTFTVNNVTVPFCNNCAASLSAFAGATGTATLVDPSQPGTLEISFRAFLDENNNNVIDADECAGDLVTYTITVSPEPTFGFTATTTSGSTGTGNTNGGATTVDLYFCPGESFSFSGYSSIPGSQVGYLEEVPSGTNNVTYNGGAVTVPRAQQDFGPSMVAGLFGGPFGPYNLSSGTSGNLTQTYTPYYDADNSNSYSAGDCLGDPITLNYYINAPAQLQTTINTIQMTSNNDGVDDTDTIYLCNSAGNNLFFTQFVDIAGVTPAAQVKVQQQFMLTNVTFGPTNGTFPLSAYATPFDRNVSLVNAALPGKLIMRFRTFNDINNNNVLDAGECAGDWIMYTVLVTPVQAVTCPANLAVCENAAAFVLTGGSPAGGTYSGTGVSAGMFDPAAAGPGTHTITYSLNNCSSCTFTITVNAAATVSFEIGGSSVTTTNNGAADPAESATVEVCDGGTYGVSNLVHSSATNRYSITVIPSGGVLLFDGSPAGNGDITAAQFDGAVGAHTITLSNPNIGGTLVQVITPYNDVNNNGAYDAGVDCAGDPVTITYTAHPTPLLQTSINAVVVTSNNDTAEDAGAFSVCNTANNILFDYFTDLHGLTPAASVKAYQTFTVNNVTVPFCNNCAASLSAFAGATGTAALVNPSLPGTLEISFRAFLDENNNNLIDADECAGDLVTYTITVSPEPTFGFTATTTGGSTGTANTNGGATTVNLYFCPGESFSFSGYSSIPGSQVGYLEEIPSGTNNVTYNGGAVTVPRAQQDFGPSMVAGLFGGPFGPYNLSSGTSGSLTQTYTPYYDADNSNSYTAGDCLGDPITVNYYINAPAQLQTTVNTVQVTSNNNGLDDTGAFTVCNSTGNNLFFTQFADIAGVTPAAQVKVQQQFTLTNVTFGPPNGTFPLSAYGTPFDRNVSLVNTAIPGTLVMRFRTFNDINNNNVLDPGECAGDWIVYTITVNACCPPPVFTACPANQTVNTAPNLCTAVVNYTATATGAPTYTYTFNGGSSNPGTGTGSTFNKGVTNVVITATNACGPTTCSFTVTVNDNQQPGITCPANLVRGTDAGLCTAVVNYTTPTFTDNCTGASVAVVPPSLASGSAFPKGLSSVVWQVTDGAGLTKRCTFTVIVNDNQAPVITCPANQTKSTDPGLCSAVVTYTTPTFTDNCPGGSVAIVSGFNSGGTFPKGITTVQWRATDAAGLTKTCTFRVTVNDTQAPGITCPANQVKNTDPGQCSAIATYANATFTDNCPGGSVVKWTGLASGSAFPKGVNNVTFKATDAAGNFTLCTMTITVNDAQLPSIVCPANMVVTGSTSTGVCKATVVYPNPTATDNCSGVTSYLLSGLASYSDFPVGVTTNVWRAVDGSGASSTCSFTVTVSCPANLPAGNNGVYAADDAQNTADRDAELQAVNSNLLTMTLAPNPATTEVLITLDGLSEKGGLLTVFDAAGRMVWQQPVEAQQTTIMLDVAERSFAGGLYLVTLRSEGAITTKRMVVNKL